MACDNPYHNPAGDKFVTRVQYRGGDGLYTAALTSLAPMLNIPNGAGPGTLFVGTHDTYASWTIRDVKNLVTETQRTYTGPASWSQLWVEDGCSVGVQLLDRDSLIPYNDDGIEITAGAAVQPRIFAQWFPAGSEVTTFDRLSLVSGPPGTVNPYPFRGGLLSGTPHFVPPGLCRFLSVSAESSITAVIENLTAASNPTYETIAATTNFNRAIPAWGVVTLYPAQGNPNFCVSWNRFPMVGQ